MQSREALDHIFSNLWPGIPVPKMLQSLCSRKVVEDVRSVAGRFFIPTCPDLSTAVFTLAVRDNYVHIDEPLMLSGSAAESMGATQWTSKGESWKQFYQDHGSARIYSSLPLNTYIGINACAQTLLDAKKLMPEYLNGFELNWPFYFKCYHDSLLHLTESGVNVAEELRQFNEVLATRPEAEQNEVTALINAKSSSVFRRCLRGFINTVPGLRNLELIARPAVRDSITLILNGKKFGFTNIFDCAQKLPAICGSAESDQRVPTRNRGEQQENPAADAVQPAQRQAFQRGATGPDPQGRNQHQRRRGSDPNR